jgi:hypothetical protein
LKNIKVFLKVCMLGNILGVGHPWSKMPLSCASGECLLQELPWPRALQRELHNTGLFPTDRVNKT